MVKMFNFWYFFFIVLFAGIIVGLYFLLRNKSEKTQKIVLGCILFFNLALHFLKVLFPPYINDPNYAAQTVWCLNICAVNVFLFPIIFFCKNQSLKDYMVYIGILSGFGSIMYPTEALGRSFYDFETLRYYICHAIIITVPLLIMLLKLHKLNYRRIWRLPFYILGALLFVVCNHVLQSELGITSLRGNDMTAITYDNGMLIWGPTSSWVCNFFTWLTPNFMKVVPWGEFKGTPKYWPFFWMIPAIFFYSYIFAFIFCLIFDRQRIVNDFRSVVTYLKYKFKKKDKQVVENKKLIEEKE